jgi:pimeloyl-ACP methyl ester carboxylesterase
VPLPSGSIHGCLSGKGTDTIVLAAGAALTSSTWAPVVEALQDDARLLAFDRPGLGQSASSLLPRTPTQIAREIHRLIGAMEIDGPLILVGHSMGGVHMLRYASLYPEGVQAVLTLDTPPPGFEGARLRLLTPAEREQRKEVRATGLLSAPEVVRLEREGAEIPAEWRFPDFPRQLPLTVVVADAQDFGELGSLEEHRRLWITESRQWLSLSDRSSLVLAEGSGHMIHRQQLELVVGLLRRELSHR